MDMYYKLKDELSCQECKFPLSYSEDVGYMSYIAVCPACGKKYEVTLETKVHHE
jgi:uncharacterized protein YbaR (Trm112 family)